MTASTIKSDNIAITEANPLVALRKKRGVLKALIDHKLVPTTSTDEAGDIILFGPIESNAVPISIKAFCDDLDSSTGLAWDLGVYYSGKGGTQVLNGNVSGTVVDADNIAAAAAFQSAVVTGTEIRFEAADIANQGQELWEIAGLSADCGGEFFLGLKASTPATTPVQGDVSIQVLYL